jgi:hypothetical protein
MDKTTRQGNPLAPITASPPQGLPGKICFSVLLSETPPQPPHCTHRHAAVISTATRREEKAALARRCPWKNS